MNSYELYNRMRWGTLSHDAWVRPENVAVQYGEPLVRVRQCLSRMVSRGEVVRRPDSKDGRKSQYALAGRV